MKSGWRIGSIFGIPLLINASWFLILGLFTLYFGSSWQWQNWGTIAAWVAGFAISVLLFGSVLLHELGHSLVARSQGIPVNSITLFLFGGVAAIDEESKTPGQAFRVAIAGPAASLGLCLLLTLIRSVLPPAAPAATVVATLAGINLVLALFNMIPGLPLDGGQVLKAAIWQITGSRLQGVRWAARTGQLLGWTAITLGIVGYFTSSLVNVSWVWIALLGWFGVRHANAYCRITDLQEALMQLKAADAMNHSHRIVEPNLTVGQFADRHLPDAAYFVVENGDYRGMISPEDLPHSQEDRSLQSIMQPLANLPTVAETAPLAQVVMQLEAQKLRQIAVLTPAGGVAGVVDRGDIIRSIAGKLRISVSEALIQQVKEAAVYPPGLQLAAIAKAV